MTVTSGVHKVRVRFGFYDYKVSVWFEFFSFPTSAFQFSSVLWKIRALVPFVRFGFGSIPISTCNTDKRE